MNEIDISKGGTEGPPFTFITLHGELHVPYYRPSTVLLEGESGKEVTKRQLAAPCSTRIITAGRQSGVDTKAAADHSAT